MKEKYYFVSKDIALRAGLTSKIRTEVDGLLAVSEKDMRNISLTEEEKTAALGATEYVEPIKKKK